MARARLQAAICLAALGALTSCYRDSPELRHLASADSHVFALLEDDRPVTRCLNTLTVSTVSPRYFEDEGQPGLSMTDYITDQSTTIFDPPRCLSRAAFVWRGEAFVFDGIALPQGSDGGFLVAAKLAEGGQLNSGPIAFAPDAVP